MDTSVVSSKIICTLCVLKTCKNRCWFGFCPRPRWGSLGHSLRPPYIYIYRRRKKASLLPRLHPLDAVCISIIAPSELASLVSRIFISYPWKLCIPKIFCEFTFGEYLGEVSLGQLTLGEQSDLLGDLTLGEVL